MVPDREKYRQFRRNMKLLLHPKDVPDLQFSSKTERKGEIPPEVEISMVYVTSSTNLVEKSGEISPQNSVKTPFINAGSEFIVDRMGDLEKHGKIPPAAATKEETKKLHPKWTWFENLVNCISKWSKALKMGVLYSRGLDINHTSIMNPRENDKHGFSFFV